jgi:hypothetical protein
MKLGELIEALSEYRACTIGVDDETEVKIQLSDAGVWGVVEDVKAEITMTRGYNRQRQAVVILEGVEV